MRKHTVQFFTDVPKDDDLDTTARYLEDKFNSAEENGQEVVEWNFSVDVRGREFFMLHTISRA